MEEDIKVLEKYVEKDIPCNSCKYCTERPKVAGALRNLIKRNKELEEKVNKYEKQIDLEWVEENYIEKSKVREVLDTKYIVMFEGDTEFPDDATIMKTVKYVKVSDIEELLQDKEMINNGNKLLCSKEETKNSKNI